MEEATQASGTLPLGIFTETSKRTETRRGAPSLGWVLKKKVRLAGTPERKERLGRPSSFGKKGKGGAVHKNRTDLGPLAERDLGERQVERLKEGKQAGEGDPRVDTSRTEG